MAICRDAQPNAHRLTSMCEGKKKKPWILERAQCTKSRAATCENGIHSVRLKTRIAAPMMLRVRNFGELNVCGQANRSTVQSSTPGK